MNHQFFMRAALEQAKRAASLGETPVGAVVIDAQGAIIAQAHNEVEARCSQRWHAELIALEHAARHTGDWRLTGCWLYVTMEPCLMCFGALVLSRTQGLAYGVSSPDFGAFSSIDRGRDNFYLKNTLVVRGIEEEACATLLRDFFNKARSR